MIEVETKYRSPGNGKVIDELRSMGAEKISEGPMEDIYFAHPARDFGKTDEAVRIRSSDGRCELTYKGPRMASSSAKAREELTVAVDDGLAARRMLERLGFREFAVIRKHRVSFVHDKLRIEVDDVEELGQFVELELVTEDPSRAEELMDHARKGLSLTRPVPETYLEMLLEAGRKE
ncbi:TPA: class IV adenylate cyclase [Thermoplasmata archaeon]|nr:class IV adenylate cyclase [Thermoplasmata archaeon]